MQLHVSILGAGSVGVAVASSLTQGRLLRRISLFDLVKEKADGEALDFAHAAPLLGNVEVDGGSMAEAVGGDLAILTAGAKQREGESRESLLARNAQALDAIARAVEARGLPRIALVVTNPVDAMTHRLRQRWGPRGVSVIGSGTLLDTMRLREVMARRLEVSGESVHAYVIGEHGDSSVSLLDSASVGGSTLAETAQRRGLSWDADTEWSAAQEHVRRAAYKVIARKGATSHAIGVAVARIVRAIAHDEGAVLPVSVPYEDISISVPACVAANGAISLGSPSMSDREAAAFAESVIAVRRMCTALGSIPST